MDVSDGHPPGAGAGFPAAIVAIVLAVPSTMPHASPSPPLPRSVRILAASGALLAAASVGLAAYGSHVAADVGQRRLLIAAVFAFGHGVALVALGRTPQRPLALAALLGLLAGTLLFAGSLAAAHFLGASTGLAPVGGSLMILAWLLYAADALRR